MLLVSEAAYRFAFSAERTGALWLPGLRKPQRLLGLEPRAGALAGARRDISPLDKFWDTTQARRAA